MGNKFRHRDTDAAGPQGTVLFRPEDLPLAAPALHEDGPDANRPRLTGIGAPFEGRSFVLRRGRTLIGRRPNNDVVLAEPSVSAQHAWIIDEGSRYRVINALSTNGTFVNERKVHEAMLLHGDRVRFGTAEFLFEAGRPPTWLDRLRRAAGAIWPWIAGACLLALGAGALIFLR